MLLERSHPQVKIGAVVIGERDRCIPKPIPSPQTANGRQVRIDVNSSKLLVQTVYCMP